MRELYKLLLGLGILGAGVGLFVSILFFRWVGLIIVGLMAGALILSWAWNIGDTLLGD